MLRTSAFILSCLLVLLGTLLYLTHWNYASYFFATGAAGVTVYYLTIPYKSVNFRLRRLQRINVFAGISMIIASVFMYKRQMSWVAFLLISALLQLYTSFTAKDNESGENTSKK